MQARVVRFINDLLIGLVYHPEKMPLNSAKGTYYFQNNRYSLQSVEMMMA